MRKNHLLLLLMLSTAIIACKPGKQSGTGNDMKQNDVKGNSAQNDGKVDNSQVVKEQQETWTREQAQAGPADFRLVVSFISIGAGTDPDAKVLLDKFISEYVAKSGKSVKYIMIPWGREGEVDCCFNMNELTASEQKDFIESLKVEMKGKELIQINENARNRFKQ